MTLWMGQDGFDYSFQGDYGAMWDNTIEAMDAVGRMLPPALCCTGLGGLSVTPTSRKIELHLADT